METFSALLAISLICVWINGWVNNREAGDLKRHRGYYDVIVMISEMGPSVNTINSLKPGDAYIRQ